MASSDIAILYGSRDSVLTTEDALKILLNPSAQRISHTAASQPTSGQMFLYSTTNNGWQKDGLAWTIRGRSTMRLNGKSSIVKTYHIQKGVLIHRHAYQLPDKATNEILVHYLLKNKAHSSQLSDSNFMSHERLTRNNPVSDWLIM